MNSQVPYGIFFSLLPHRQVMTGTEDAEVRRAPFRPGLRLLNGSIPQGVGYCRSHYAFLDAGKLTAELPIT